MGLGVRRSGSLSSVTRSKMGGSCLSSMPSMKVTRASEPSPAGCGCRSQHNDGYRPMRKSAFGLIRASVAPYDD
jgi:hypothetical protein